MAKGATVAQKLRLSLAKALDFAHAVPGAGAGAVRVWAQGVTPGCDVCQLADVTATAVLRPGGSGRRSGRPLLRSAVTSPQAGAANCRLNWAAGS